MKGFSLAPLPAIRFGAGCRSTLPSLLAAYGKKVLLLASPSILASGRLPDWKTAGLEYLVETSRGEPGVEAVDTLAERYRGAGVAVVCAVGGGSVLDLGKAVAAMLCEQGSVLRFLEGVGSEKPPGRTLPFVAVPTTAGTGSECTKNAVIAGTLESGLGFKKSLRHDAYVPVVAVVDPELSLGLPRDVTVSSGLDALTQLLEAYVATAANPVTDQLCEDALERGGRAFLRGMEDPEDLEARGEMAYAATVSGICLANAGLGTVHGIAGVLGALSDIPHGLACGLLLAPTFAASVGLLTTAGAPGPALHKLERAGRLLRGAGQSGAETPGDPGALVETLRHLSSYLNPGTARLSSWGFDRVKLGRVAEQSDNKNNPASLGPEARYQILLSVL